MAKAKRKAGKKKKLMKASDLKVTKGGAIKGGGEVLRSWKIDGLRGV